jgi:two-component sensor histidine kinase
MTIGLVVGSFFLVVVLLVLLKNFLALKKGTNDLKSINEEFAQTRLSSDEKDILIKEIHHRVKNNLQIIKSLIRLQNSSIEDAVIQNILMDFENRVTSMALVHESLYKSLDLSKVNVKEYYTKLLNDLIQAYTIDIEIEGNFDINIENFGIDTLIPLGLLTNEIISNALKHGFEGMTKGIITVKIEQFESGLYQLIIGDNGIGMHERFQNKQSLGMELIETLVEQLDGEMTRIIENGTHYIITFKSQDKN